MCGIAGIIQSDDLGLGIEELKKMTEVLTHRGKDGNSTWQNSSGTALLGHCRLSVIDTTEKGAQPMHFRERYTIIHNGEIYNYIELKQELIAAGYSFISRSDTEVILAAFDYWYDECVEHFDGMFAFAIWDNEERELFAARDRFGEKPFFYSFDGQTFQFASEMKALWASGLERQPNLQMLFNFITIGYTDNPDRTEETFYNNIFKLPPASRLFYYPDEKELTIDKYWDIDIEKRLKNISDQEAIEKFEQLFSSSVNRRLRSDIQIGASLSGGLDSSSIMATITGSGSINYPPQAFTAIFSGFEKDESIASRKVADRFGAKHHTVNITAEDLVNDWEKLCYHQEEPFGSASIYAQYKVFELAGSQNIKVLLDGQGADETLAGYHKYYKWYWQELFIKRKLMKSRELRMAKENGITEEFNFKNVIASLFPDFASVILERQYLLKALRNESLTKDFIRQQSKEAYYSTPTHYNLSGALYFNTCMHGLEELLRYADRNAMAHGCEVRLPFLQHELVEFIFSLPSNFKIREGWTKWLLRKSMDKKLPADITWRAEKIGFEPPQKQWMENKNLQELIHEAKKKMVNRNILKKQVLEMPVQPLSSHAAENFDWRYLAAASFI